MAGELEVAGGASRPASWIVSLVVHGGALALVFAFAGGRVGTSPARVETTPIEIVEPPQVPPAPAGQGASKRGQAVANASPGALGRHGRDAAPRSMSRAPAVADPRADLVVNYDAPTGPDPGNPAGTVGPGPGAGLLGDGTGGHGSLGSDNDIAALRIPEPPPAEPVRSLARPPRAKHPYRQWELFGERDFRPTFVLLELTIDPQGVVRDIRVLEADDAIVGKRASNLARNFEFYPALDAAGQPTWGLHRWEFTLRPGSPLRVPR
jgi:hypothetical protein